MPKPVYHASRDWSIFGGLNCELCRANVIIERVTSDIGKDIGTSEQYFSTDCHKVTTGPDGDTASIYWIVSGSKDLFLRLSGDSVKPINLSGWIICIILRSSSKLVIQSTICRDRPRNNRSLAHALNG